MNHWIKVFLQDIMGLRTRADVINSGVIFVLSLPFGFHLSRNHLRPVLAGTAPSLGFFADPWCWLLTAAVGFSFFRFVREAIAETATPPQRKGG